MKHSDTQRMLLRLPDSIKLIKADSEGILLEVPFAACPVFAEEYVDRVADIVGAREADLLLEDVAIKLQNTMVLRLIEKAQ